MITMLLMDVLVLCRSGSSVIVVLHLFLLHAEWE